MLFGYNQRRTTSARDFLDGCPYFVRHRAANLRDVSGNGVGRPFPNFEPVQVNAGHAGLRAEGYKVGFVRGQFAATQTVSVLCENHD